MGDVDQLLVVYQDAVAFLKGAGMWGVGIGAVVVLGVIGAVAKSREVRKEKLTRVWGWRQVLTGMWLVVVGVVLVGVIVLLVLVFTAPDLVAPVLERYGITIADEPVGPGR